jgi:hypothetical protein
VRDIVAFGVDAAAVFAVSVAGERTGLTFGGQVVPVGCSMGGTETLNAVAFAPPGTFAGAVACSAVGDYLNRWRTMPGDPTDWAPGMAAVLAREVTGSNTSDPRVSPWFAWMRWRSPMNQLFLMHRALASQTTRLVVAFDPDDTVGYGASPSGTGFINAPTQMPNYLEQLAPLLGSSVSAPTLERTTLGGAPLFFDVPSATVSVYINPRDLPAGSPTRVPDDPSTPIREDRIRSDDHCRLLFDGALARGLDRIGISALTPLPAPGPAARGAVHALLVDSSGPVSAETGEPADDAGLTRDAAP